jgi:hypothetical protein
MYLHLTMVQEFSLGQFFGVSLSLYFEETTVCVKTLLLIPTIV